MSGPVCNRGQLATMPELPEVETLRRQLEATLLGKAIISVELSRDAPQLVRGMTREEFAGAIHGRRIAGIRRRGKWLIFDLSGGLKFVMHLRMTGRLLLRTATDAPDPYLHARLMLDDGRELRWCDARKFGTWNLVTDLVEVTGSLGPEPFGDEFSPEALLAAATGRRAPIKAFLLDQRRVAGLGNIYVDEALWRAGIHPLREAGSLTLDEARRLCDSIVDVLHASLDSGGSSMRDYLDTAGRRGRFQDYWQVYKRAGQPCYRCSSEIVKIRVSGRGTHLCPVCQPAPTPHHPGPLLPQGEKREPSN